MQKRLIFAAAALSASVVCAAHASATQITGSIYFGQGFASNGYDPAAGGVPPGYGNETSTTVTVGPGIEFGFQDEYNRDTADFSSTSLVLTDDVLNGAAGPWQQTFTADSNYFSQLTLASTSFFGLTYNVIGDTLTVDWPGEYGTAATYTATFSVSSAPEPSTWALMIAGIAGVGLMLRRARKTAGVALKSAFAA